MSKARTFRPGGSVEETSLPSRKPAPGTERFHTTVTERADFRTCRRRWYLTTVERLGQRDKVEWNLIFGEVVHKALECYYRGNKRNLNTMLQGFRRAWKKEDTALYDTYRSLYDYGIGEEWLNWKEKGEQMLRYYDIYDRQADFQWDRVIEVINVESRLFVDILGQAGEHQYFLDDWEDENPLPLLSGRPDLIVERSDGIWVVDHKTASNAYNARALDIDDQLTGLCYLVWRIYGIIPTGALYNALIKDPPKPPKELVSGALSTDKSQRTTYDLYMQAIKERGLDYYPYSEILEYLKEKKWNQFFLRDAVQRNVEELESFEERLFREYKDMDRIHKDPSEAYPNPSQWNCGGCPVLPLCQAMEEKGNVEFVKDNMYEVKEPRTTIPKAILSPKWKGV